jgi:hypothetical protein
MGAGIYQENIMQMIRSILMVCVIVWATLIGPRLEDSDPFVGVFVAFACLSAGVSLYFDWEEKRIRNRKK